MMKKIIVFVLMFVTLMGLVGCTKQTTSSESLVPEDQNSLLSSISEAIKGIFD